MGAPADPCYVSTLTACSSLLAASCAVLSNLWEIEYLTHKQISCKALKRRCAIKEFSTVPSTGSVFKNSNDSKHSNRESLCLYTSGEVRRGSTSPHLPATPSPPGEARAQGPVWGQRRPREGKGSDPPPPAWPACAAANTALCRPQRDQRFLGA